MRKFWRNVFIFSIAWFLSGLIISILDHKILIIFSIAFFPIWMTSVMILIFYYVKKNRGRGEYQQLIERKRLGWKFK